MWVTHSRMLCSPPRSCLVHPVGRFDSEGWFSSDQVIFLTVFRVFLVKKHAAFKWKDAISGFPVSPGSAEALVRCGGKIMYILIACFLRNIYAKNCHNRTVYVKIIASCIGGTFFWDTVCHLFLGLLGNDAVSSMLYRQPVPSWALLLVFAARQLCHALCAFLLDLLPSPVQLFSLLSST